MPSAWINHSGRLLVETPLAAMDGAGSDPLWLTALVIKWWYRPHPTVITTLSGPVCVWNTLESMCSPLPEHLSDHAPQTEGGKNTILCSEYLSWHQIELYLTHPDVLKKKKRTHLHLIHIFFLGIFYSSSKPETLMPDWIKADFNSPSHFFCNHNAWNNTSLHFKIELECHMFHYCMSGNDV